MNLAVKGESTDAVHEYLPDELVIGQFRECCQLSIPSLIKKLKTERLPETRVREEAIVMLARHYDNLGNRKVAWELVDVLADRVSLSLGRAVRLWRLTPVVAEEVIDLVLSNLYESVFEPGECRRFWEIRFWVCFDRYLITILKKSRRNSDLIIDSDTQIETEPLVSSGKSSAHSEWLDPAFRAVVAEGLGQLEEHERTAFMLKHWAGFPESSGDANEKKTIAVFMGVTDRTVRNYLARAENKLNGWRSGQQSSPRKNREGQ